MVYEIKLKPGDEMAAAGPADREPKTNRRLLSQTVYLCLVSQKYLLCEMFHKLEYWGFRLIQSVIHCVGVFSTSNADLGCSLVDIG